MKNKKILSIICSIGAVMLTIAGLTTTADSVMIADVDNDGVINAVDASLVLEEYARLSTGKDSAFSANQKIAGDVDFNSQIDAVDASLILSYYAYVSTGGELNFEGFINKSEEATSKPRETSAPKTTKKTTKTTTTKKETVKTTVATEPPVTEPPTPPVTEAPKTEAPKVEESNTPTGNFSHIGLRYMIDESAGRVYNDYGGGDWHLIIDGGTRWSKFAEAWYAEYNHDDNTAYKAREYAFISEIFAGCDVVYITSHWTQDDAYNAYGWEADAGSSLITGTYVDEYGDGTYRFVG